MTFWSRLIVSLALRLYVMVWILLHISAERYVGSSIIGRTC